MAMESEIGNREQYEHILAQVAQLDRAAQINLLLDLAARMRKPTATGPTTKQILQEEIFKAFDHDHDEGDAFAELMTFHRGRRLNGLTLKDLMTEGRR